MSAPLEEPNAVREAARLWRLAWPVGLGMLGHVAMGTTDTIIVGQLGDEALASMAMGNIWTFAALILAIGALRALDPVVSQAFGAGDQTAVGEALAKGVSLALWLFLGLVPWYLLAEPGLHLLGQPAVSIPDAASYSWMLIFGLPFTLAFSAVRAWLQGFEVMRPATVAILLGNLLNVPLDLLLVHGAGPVPALGPAGAGIATSLCNAFLLGVLLWLVRDRIRGVWRGFGPHLALRAQLPLLAIGVPLGLQTGLEVWAFNATGIFVGWYGETALSAHAIALNLASITFMYAMGLSQAGATRVGNLVGAGLPWKRAAILAVVMGGLGMGLSATLFRWMPGPLAAAYTPDLEVQLLAASLIPIAGLFQVFDGLQVTMFGVLRGAGDVKVPTLANVLGYWIVGIPLGYWLAFEAGYGPQGVWYGLVVGLMVVCLFLAIRLRHVMTRGGTRL